VYYRAVDTQMTGWWGEIRGVDHKDRATTSITKLLLRPEEEADLLSIGRSKIYELIGTGELASVRIGASRRIPAEALSEFVRELSNPVPSSPLSSLERPR
jgi:excisionase family DNA binding protein